MSHPAPNLATLSDKELIEHLETAEADKTAADLAARKLKNELLNRKRAELDAAYRGKPEPYGIVNLTIEGKTIKIDTVKVIEWDQAQLEGLWKQIIADGAEPKEYISVEYKVSEALYKTWGANIKAFFEPARTVKARAPSVKIIEEKE